MKVVLIQATFQPVFAVLDADGRVVQTLDPPEKTWVLYHLNLAGLQARVEEFEGFATSRLQEPPAAEAPAQSPELPPDPAPPAR